MNDAGNKWTDSKDTLRILLSNLMVSKVKFTQCWSFLIFSDLRVEYLVGNFFMNTLTVQIVISGSWFFFFGEQERSGSDPGPGMMIFVTPGIGHF